MRISTRSLSAWVGIALTTTLMAQGCIPLAITGTAAGVSVATDRRSSGAYIDDQAIEMKARSELKKDYRVSQGHINITSYNRYVLVTGEVPTPEAKVTAIELIRRVENVQGVFDELTVGPNSALTSRASDSKITASVKQRMMGARTISSGDVKVVTENGVVYIMGLLSREETEAAAYAASTTAGVVKVVTLTQHLPDTDPRVAD